MKVSKKKILVVLVSFVAIVTSVYIYGMLENFLAQQSGTRAVDDIYPSNIPVKEPDVTIAHQLASHIQMVPD